MICIIFQLLTDPMIYLNLELFGDINDEQYHQKSIDSAPIQRIVQSLNYRSFLLQRAATEEEEEMAMNTFTEFCDEHYGTDQMLADYMHFMDDHSAPDSVKQIAAKLQVDCGGVRGCGCTSRHFRERGGGRKEFVEKEASTDFYNEKMDSLHFYLCHLEEMGLRVPVDKLQPEMKEMDEKVDGDLLVDHSVKKMKSEVTAGKKVESVSRFDGANNTKFTVSTTEQKEEVTTGLHSVFLSLQMLFHCVSLCILSKC